VPEELREELIQAAEKRDIEACSFAAIKMYGLNDDERSAVGGTGE
jgi:hypothetical protein